ncbi:MAG: hypothetical protein Kow0092_19480 [Deferrisomatales bacterium]
MATVWRALVAGALLSALPALAQEAAPQGLSAGTRMPPLAGVGLDGEPVSLERYLGRGTLVLSFWSIHCVDCIRELDDLRSIRREFPRGDVTVVAVNADSGLPPARVRGFVRRYEAARGPLDVVHVLDRDTAILNALNIRYIPVLAVVDRSGRVTSVLTGYAPEDRSRVAAAVEQGSVALGAWGEGLRGRLRTILRSTGPGGAPVEWGSFRVEAGMPLFGLHDGRGWLADAAGRRDRASEAARVEQVVADRLKVSLLQTALASVGVRLPPPETRAFGEGGIRVPESPFVSEPRWKSLYDALGFEGLSRREDSASAWVGDRYWAALVGDVDLARLRAGLEALGFPREAERIRLETVSDFDFKPRAVLDRLRKRSPRLQAIQGQHLVYYGSASQLARELQDLDGLPFRVFVEAQEPQTVRMEIY